MQQPNPSKKNTGSKTNAQKVKREIKRDEQAGIGDMTSREAGSMKK